MTRILDACTSGQILFSFQKKKKIAFLLKPVFLVCFSYSSKDKSFLILLLFTSEYLDQIPPWRN